MSVRVYQNTGHPIGIPFGKTEYVLTLEEAEELQGELRRAINEVKTPRAALKIKLVFLDWKFRGQSIYSTHWGLELTKGDFHSGSTFEGEIKLDRYQEQELRKAILREYQPCFWVSACGDEIKLKGSSPLQGLEESLEMLRRMIERDEIKLKGGK